MSLVSFLWAGRRRDRLVKERVNALRSPSQKRILRSSVILSLAITALIGLQVKNAEAKRLKRLSVVLQEVSNVMEFSFSAKGETLKASQLKVERDLPNRLKVTVDGVRCRRSWQRAWKATGLKRALLYPSKSAKGRCYLKIKMGRKISQQQLEAIQVVGRGEGVTIRFAWQVEALGEGVVLLDSADTPKAEGKAEKAPTPPKSGKLVASKPLADESMKPTDQGREDKTSKNATRQITSVGAQKELSEPSESTQAALEPIEDAPIGELPDMRVEEDRLGIQERPHSIIETVTLGQVEKARAYSPAPIILSTPISLSNEERSETEEGFLRRASIFFGALLDREALSRGGSIWLSDESLRAQTQRLNTNLSQLSISQERLIAKHVGANLISRAQLSLDETNPEASLSLSISMVPVDPESPAGPSDPGIYRVKHEVSRALIEEALSQTWVTERRDDAIMWAAISPGLGHIYRGERRLGWTYLSSSLALSLGAIISGTLGYLAASDYESNSPTTAHRRADANAHYDRANLLWMGVGTLYISSLVDTLLSARDHSALDLERLDWDRVRRSVESRGMR